MGIIERGNDGCALKWNSKLKWKRKFLFLSIWWNEQDDDEDDDRCMIVPNFLSNQPFLWAYGCAFFMCRITD